MSLSKQLHRLFDAQDKLRRFVANIDPENEIYKKVDKLEKRLHKIINEFYLENEEYFTTTTEE
jgi:hypothetical protein